LDTIRSVAFALLVAAAGCGSARADDSRADEPSRCASIPGDRYQTGLLFNPDGMQTYYDRARCFQELAVVLRDPRLCARVVQRRSWFLDGSAISPGACRKRVTEQIGRDADAASRLQAPQRLRDVAVERDNNGHDFSVRVRTTGGDGMSLRLTLAIVDASGQERPLQSEPQSMTRDPEEVLIFIPAPLLAKASGGHMDQPLRLRATLQRELADPDDRAVHAHAPQMPLRSSVETVFVPAALERMVMRP
jgi:hypothetical protein